MSPRPGPRLETCGPGAARTRLEQAEKFHEVALLAALESDDVAASRSVSAALSVLAGIAASDAACCARLGQRPRGQSHHQALDLIRQIAPGGEDAAKHLKHLLDLKDGAHYGVIHVTRRELEVALRHASALVDFSRARARS